jgi:hypothetical protein
MKNEAYIKEAVNSIPPSEWSTFFETLRQEKYQQIRSAENGDGLIAIRETIKALDQLELKFKNFVLDKQK